MKRINNWVTKLATGVAAFALMIAVSSVSATCWFTIYQPDVPENLL